MMKMSKTKGSLAARAWAAVCGAFAYAGIWCVAITPKPQDCVKHGGKKSSENPAELQTRQRRAPVRAGEQLVVLPGREDVVLREERLALLVEQLGHLDTGPRSSGPRRTRGLKSDLQRRSATSILSQLSEFLWSLKS